MEDNAASEVTPWLLAISIDLTWCAGLRLGIDLRIPREDTVAGNRFRFFATKGPSYGLPTEGPNFYAQALPARMVGRVIETNAIA